MHQRKLLKKVFFVNFGKFICSYKRNFSEINIKYFKSYQQTINMALRIISRRMCQLSNYRRFAPIASSCIQNMKFSFDDNSALSLKCGE